MAEDDKGFLTRWSRLKRDPEPEPPSPEALAAAAEAEAEAEAAAAEVARSEEDQNREAAEAIDLEAMAYGDDFSAFLKRGVPDLLRRTALRKFFNSNPLLANLDGLNDYDIDYNTPAHKFYKSSWTVARGFLTEAEQAAQQATGRISRAIDAAEALLTDPEEAPLVADEAEAEAETPLPEAAAPEGALAEAIDPPELPDSPPRVSIRRRLQG